MAAGDFTATVLKNIQTEIATLFQGGGMVNSIFDTPVESARSVLENQTFRALPRFDREGKCITIEGYFWTSGQDALDYEGSSADSGLDACALPTGHEGESDKEDYSPNLFKHTTQAIDDNLCSNAYDFASLSANSLLHAMALLRSKINESVIAHFAANNMAAPAVGGLGYTVDGGGLIEVPAADWTADLVGKMYQIAMINQVNNIRILSGANLFQQIFNAGFNALNDNQRDQLAKYNFLGQITNDLRAFDGVIGGNPSTFIYDPNVLGFSNMAPYQRGLSYVPKQIPANDGIRYIFLMDDPILKYRRTSLSDPKNPNSRVVTEMVPVTYIVEYQQLCSDRDSLSLPTFEHRYLVQFVGGMHQAPTIGGRTGIIQLEKVA